MGEELEQLRARVQQLEVERDRLQQERDAAEAGPSTQGPPSLSISAMDRIVYLPRERKCPVFRGPHGIGVDEWVEEIKTSMRVRHVGPADKAAFVFDHLGYLEPDVEVGGEVIPRRGILVVKDPPGQVGSPQVPGIIGMNVIKAYYQRLYSQHGPRLFDLQSVLGAPTSWLPAFQLCHQAELKGCASQTSVAKLRGRRTIAVPAGCTKFVPATCSSVFTSTGSALIEPLNAKFGLPDGLLVSPSLVTVMRGTAYVPVVNAGVSTVFLKPRCALGILSPVEVISLPSGLQVVPCAEDQVVAAVRSHTAESGSVTEKIKSLDRSMLSEAEQNKVRALLLKYESVFSAFEGDLGCANLITHSIPLLDEAPVRQRYRRIPPSEYEAVKSLINQLLASHVIRESSSPYASPIVLVRKKDGSLRLCRLPAAE